MRVKAALNIDELAKLAQRRLPKVAADYLFGGAEDETSLVRNRRAFAAWDFVPLAMTGAPSPSLATRLFGKPRAVPFVVGPTGLNGLFWHGGDSKLARAAGKAGAVFACSTASNELLEDIAAASSDASWFQLYPLKDRAISTRLVSRAQAAGYEALIITVDALVPGKRERDLRNEFAHDIRLGPRRILDGLLHPRWLTSVILRHGFPRMANLSEFLAADATAHDAATFMRVNRDPQFGWDDARRIKDTWKGPVLIKGILAPEDVYLAASHGFDGVILSNHGGRQLDGAAPPLTMLADLMQRGVPALPVIVDGGFRRGTDIVKALCLGASAVLLGRAALFGLAAGGEQGAARALEVLSDETRRTMALLGCPTVDSLSPALLRGRDR